MPFADRILDLVEREAPGLRALILGMRVESEHSKQAKSAEIMDVAPAAVESVLREFGYPRLIHGHTHRPARHVHQVDGHACERWVLNDWGDETETQKQGIFAMAARYFKNTLVFSGGARLDNWKREVRSRPTSFGFLPGGSWDGWTLNNSYWRPDAPADWKTLTYTPKDANGNPTSTVPILAIDRPTITGANGVLGHATAQYFLERDPACAVFLGVRERQERAQGLVERFPDRAFLCPLEITAPESWQTALAWIEQQRGQIVRGDVIMPREHAEPGERQVRRAGDREIRVDACAGLVAQPARDLMPLRQRRAQRRCLRGGAQHAGRHLPAPRAPAASRHRAARGVPHRPRRHLGAGQPALGAGANRPDRRGSRRRQRRWWPSFLPP